MLYNNKTFPLTLALLLSFGVYIKPTFAKENPQLSVTKVTEKGTTFSFSDNLLEGSVVKISSSQNVKQINNNLKQKFEAEYLNTIAVTPTTTADTSDTTTDNTPVNTTEQKSSNWLWFLLPLALLIFLLAFLMRKRQDYTTTEIDCDRDDRELVGAGVGRTPLNPDGDDDGIVAGTALAKGLGEKAIADSRQEQSKVPGQIDLDAPVEDVRNKFDHVTTSKIETTDVTNIGGTGESIDNRLDNVTTTNINTPDPYINAIDIQHRFDDAPNNINTSNIANLETTAEAVPHQLENVTITNINPPESYIEVRDVYQTFDDVPTHLSSSEVTELENIQGIAAHGDRLNPEPPNVRSENFLDQIKDQAAEIADDVSNKASENKDNLTIDSDRQI